MPCINYQNQTDCLNGGCYWVNGRLNCQSCNDGSICATYDSEAVCLAQHCFWYDGSCHCDPSPNPQNFTVVKDCLDAGCYWYNGSCHSEMAPSCESITDAEGCMKAPWCGGVGSQEGGCYWYNNGCHPTPNPNPGDYEHMLFACPNYDEATQNLYYGMVNYWLPYAQNKGIWSIHQAMSTNCEHDNIHNICKQFDPKGLIEGGHGTQYALTGHDNYAVWWNEPKYWMDDIAGKIFYFISCYTAIWLCPTLVNSYGGRAYASFNDVSYSSTAQYYIECFGEFWYSLCDGATVEAAYARTLAKYQYWIDQTGSANLIWNRDHFVMGGDATARLLPQGVTDEDETITITIAGPILQEYYNGAGPYALSIFNGSSQGQTFTPLQSHTLTSVKVNLGKSGSPPSGGILTANIYATSNGLPTGSPISTGSMLIDPITTSYNWYSITMSSVQLSQGVQYALCLSLNVGTYQNYIKTRKQTGDPYPRGIHISKTAVNWTKDTAYDMLFEEWGISTKYK